MLELEPDFVAFVAETNSVPLENSENPIAVQGSWPLNEEGTDMPRQTRKMRFETLDQGCFVVERHPNFHCSSMQTETHSKAPEYD